VNPYKTKGSKDELNIVFTSPESLFILSGYSCRLSHIFRALYYSLFYTHNDNREFAA